MDPHPKFGLGIKIDVIRHTLRGMKKFLTHIMRFSEESKTGYQAGQ